LFAGGDDVLDHHELDAGEFSLLPSIRQKKGDRLQQPDLAVLTIRLDRI
jgi:hypothetical protein